MARSWLSFAVLFLPSLAVAQDPAETEETEAPADDGPAPVLRSDRIEFDERLIRGQSASSGAVYLFKRTPRDLPGLVPVRQSYRRQIVEPVLGARPLQPVISTAPVEVATEDDAEDASGS
ncbi:MAG: hypothetical protein AAFV53_41040 [Myxococcota bacterium]